MGIYFDDSIYGIRIVRENDILFEEIVDITDMRNKMKLGNDQLKKAFEFYESLESKFDIRFYTYMKYTSTLEYNNSFTDWSKITLEEFLLLKK